MEKSKLTARILVIALVSVLIGTMLGGLPAFIDKAEASPAPIYVPDNYPTIQAAVDAANAGDTIIVRDGTYTENVDVSKRLTIESENGPSKTIVEPASTNDHVIEITASYVVLSGLQVHGDAYPPPDAAVIRLAGASNCSIMNNLLWGGYWYGISLVGAQHNSIFGNTIHSFYESVCLVNSHDNDIVGNNVTDAVYFGIDLDNSSQNVISGNSFIGDGVFVRASHNTVQDNVVNGKPLVYLEGASNRTVAGSNVGQVILVGCDRITVDGLTLDRTTVGIQLWHTTDSTIRNSSVSWATYGIHLDQSVGNVITGNSPNGYCGIFLAVASQNTITRNDVTDSAYAIGSLQANNNVIYLNNFRSMYGNYAEENLCNSPQEFVYTCGRRSYKSYLGNYWSKYSGSDTNRDGIGDTPYPIEAIIGGGPIISGQDNYPLMQPFNNYTIRATIPPPRRGNP